MQFCHVTALALTLTLLVGQSAAQHKTSSLRLAKAATHRLQGRVARAADGRISYSVMLPPHADARSLGLLPVAPGVGAVRLLPSEVESFTANHPGIRLAWSPPLRPQLDVAASRNFAPQFRNATGLDGAGVVVGIIDTGIDLAHPDLRDDKGSTRVAWLLDLSRQPTGKHPDLEVEFGCTDPTSGGCAVYDGADIDAALATPDSAEVPRDGMGHGTHVASIAAGNGRGSDSKDHPYIGIAPGAVLVAARVMRVAEDINDTDVLQATRFVFDRAQAMGMPAAVNVSLGADFGPHDGSTPLEKGLAAMVGPDYPGRCIVVASGNSGTLYVKGDLTLGVHTEARVVPGATVRVPMLAPLTESGAVTGSIFVWIGWRAGDSISVGIADPDGNTWIDPVPPNEVGTYHIPKRDRDKVSAQVINSLVFEGSPLTEDSPGAVILIEGTWPSNSSHKIILEGHGTADLWVQGLGDAAPGIGIGELFERAVKYGTVNVPATSPALIAVGATQNRSSWMDARGDAVSLASFGPQRPPIDDSVTFFSGAGPTRSGVSKPEICAPGVFVAAAMSRDAQPGKNPLSMFADSGGQCSSAGRDCLVVDSQHAIASGTSMAAPMVTGAIALLLSLDAALTQPEIVALLQAGARWPQGTVPFDYQLGSGALDIEGSRAAYEALGRPIFRDPDPDRSWVLLGSPYARPDPTWIINGTLETRYSDGTIADGFDASQLELATQQAVVTQALMRVAPGLWRFSVAAPSGSGGGTMVVQVKYRGETLGRTVYLPIGVDGFVAREGYSVAGGCAAAPRHRPSDVGLEVLVAGALLTLGRIRRRREPKPRPIETGTGRRDEGSGLHDFKGGTLTRWACRGARATSEAKSDLMECRALRPDVEPHRASPSL